MIPTPPPQRTRLLGWERGAGGRIRPAVWVCPALLTLLVGVWRIGRAEVWRDEPATWSAATRFPGRLVASAGEIDEVYAPYYAFMHGWVHLFGDSAVSLRTPSLLAAAAAAGTAALLGSRMFGYWAGTLGGLVVAVVPAVSRTAQEASPYSLAMFAAALATLALFRALARPTWQRWACYGAALAFTGVCHAVALCVIAGHAVAAIAAWRCSRDRRTLRFVPAVVGAVAAISPLLLLGRRQQEAQLSWPHRPSLADMIGADDPFARGSWLGAQVFCSSWAAGAVLVLAALAWLRHDRSKVAVLTVVALLPVPVLWGLSQGGTSSYVPRCLMFTVLVWAVLAGAALAAVRPRALAVGAVVAVAAAGAPDQVANHRAAGHTGSSDAAGIIVDRQQWGDAMVYGERRTGFLDEDLARLLGDRLPRDVFLDRTAAEAGSPYAVERTDYAECLGDNPPLRLWVLTAGENSGPFTQDAVQGAPPVPPQKTHVLRTYYETAETLHPPGLTLTLMTLQESDE